MKTYSKCIALVVLLLMIVSCGGGGSNTNNSNNDTSPTDDGSNETPTVPINIFPGEGAAGIRIGSTVDEVFEMYGRDQWFTFFASLDDGTFDHELSRETPFSMRFSWNSNNRYIVGNDTIDTIIVGEGYVGTTAEKIGLGSSPVAVKGNHGRPTFYNDEFLYYTYKLVSDELFQATELND